MSETVQRLRVEHLGETRCQLTERVLFALVDLLIFVEVHLVEEGAELWLHGDELQ